MQQSSGFVRGSSVSSEEEFPAYNGQLEGTSLQARPGDRIRRNSKTGPYALLPLEHRLLSDTWMLSLQLFNIES